MKVFTILMLAVAAVYASGEDGDYKQEKKECKSTDQGCYAFQPYTVPAVGETPAYQLLYPPVPAPQNVIYYPTDMAGVLPKDECCRHCQEYGILTKTTITSYCLTIFQSPYSPDFGLDTPNIACDCYTSISGLTLDPNDHCIGDYGVFYQDPSLEIPTFPTTFPYGFVYTARCFAIEPY